MHILASVMSVVQKKHMQLCNNRKNNIFFVIIIMDVYDSNSSNQHSGVSFL